MLVQGNFPKKILLYSYATVYHPPPMETNHYNDIGELLRTARTQMRMSTDQASRLLHIRVRYLEALEDGRLSELPGLAYTRGYLQSYATFLGLDKDEILRRFEEMEAALGRKNFYFPQVFSKEKTPNNTVVWGSLGLALAVYALWAVLSHSAPERVSQVETMPVSGPVSGALVHISMSMVRDVACLRMLDVLYPPCTMAKLPSYSLMPMHGQNVSIMELAQPGSH